MSSATTKASAEAQSLEPRQHTSDLGLAHLQEALVDTNKTVLPLALSCDHLADLDLLLGLGERSNSVSPEPNAGQQPRRRARQKSQLTERCRQRRLAD